MAISSFQIHLQPGTDAIFRTNGLAISNALTAVGLLLQPDTGQVNWTTVTRNNSTAAPHYEIRKFSDNIGNPIFLRIMYGTAVSGQFIFSIACGNGTNGAGVLTGTTYELPLFCFGNGGNFTRTSFVSSDGTYLTIGLGIATVTGDSSGPQKIAIGRTRDRNGNTTSDGLDIAWCGTDFTGGGTGAANAGNRGHVYLPKDGAGFARSVGAYHTCLPPSGSGQSGDIEGRFPLYVTRGGPDYPSMSAIVFFVNDFGGVAGAGSVISFEYYGVDHSYIHCGGPYGTSSIQGNTNAVTLALRYE